MIKLIYEAFIGIWTPPFRRSEFFQQLYFVANRSLLIIVFCVSFAAVVTILETSFHMKIVIQNDSLVPGFAALLILRELGVVVMALLLTSRVGAGIASEIGTMQISEQIDALKMLGIDPVQYLVSPRLLACVFGSLILTIIANMSCLLSALLVSQHYLGFSAGMFISSMHRFVQFRDLFFAMIKGVCFGAVVPLVACYFGFRCLPGAEGVGKATTNTVVTASVSIIVIDFVLSYAFSYLY